MESAAVPVVRLAEAGAEGESAAAVSGEVATRSAAEDAANAVVANREQKQALLLFRAGSLEPKAVLLGAVTRLEVVDAKNFERSDGR